MAGGREDKACGKERRQSNTALGFGSSFAAGMAIFGLGGHWLDVKFQKEPVFTLTGIGLGLLYGAWEIWKLTSASNQQSSSGENEQDKAKGNDHDARQP